MATIIDSLIVTLGIDASAYEEGAQKAKRTQNDLTNETDKGTKKMSSGFAAVRREVLLLASAFFALKSVASFFGNTITSAANLGYLSENLRISTERINAFQRASERMGGSAEGAVGQLKESVDALAQLRSGLGPNDGLQWFFRMGGSTADLKDGNSYLLARSKIIHEIFQVDPGKAALIARQMGILDDQFDLIKQGPEAVTALTDAQEKNSSVTAQNAKEAQELLRRWLDFTDAIKGTFMKAVLALAPAITLILDKFVEWANQLGTNKDKIQDFGRSLTDFLTNTDWSGIIKDAKDFAASVKDISSNISELIKRWDEWRGAPAEKSKSILKSADNSIATGLSNTITTFQPLKDSDHPVIDMFFGGSLNKAMRQIFDRKRTDANGNEIPNDAKPSSGAGISIMDQSKYAVAKLVSMGWSQAQASGMVGSLVQESKLNPANVNPKSGAYGLAQWLSKDRVENFEKWAKRPLKGSSFDQQLEFMNYELTKGSEAKAGAAIKGAATSEQVALLHSRLYERPSADEAEEGMRQAYARQIEKSMQQSNASAAASVTAGASTAATSKVDNSKTTSSSSTTIINGGVNVHTKATDANAIAKEIKPGIERYNPAMQANSGIR